MAEGIIAGMSSGGAAAVALRHFSEIKEGVVVSIFCDRGDRYLFVFKSFVVRFQETQ